ncbi:MAG TPA: ISAs1 family transposase [Archangium sp.]|nr:ISAs1 family transposase [Archangium sp.]
MKSSSQGKKSSPTVELILEHFGTLEDPRVERTRRHPLSNILVMALCGAISGADGWEDLQLFAEAKANFFATFLDMPYGTPCADTFRRVLSALHPVRFEACFRAWVGALAQELGGQVVAIDGKAVRGALEKAGRRTTPLHLLHAWASEQNLLLGQQAVEGAPGEVQAMPALIRLLELRGATVTTDANGCTAEVAAACVETGADYALALKGNRGALHEHVQALFASTHPGAPPPPGTSFHSDVHEAHGRTETRHVWAMPLEHWPLKSERWPGARTVVLVQRERAAGAQGAATSTVERHFYLSSLTAEAPVLARTIRAHWGVENGLHWCLDVGFGEDRRRIRDREGAQNFALLARLALTLLKRETSLRRGIAGKRKQAGWVDAYLLRVLSAGFPQL